MGRRGVFVAGWVVALLATSSFAACGGGASAPPAREEDPVRMLVAAGDLGGTWVLDLGTKNGHVPDLEGWGPQPFVCDAAAGDASTTPAVVTWEATHTFQLAGRSAKVPTGRQPWTFDLRLGEFLLSGSARATRKTYDAFASSMTTCASRMPGPQYTGRTTAIDLPAVGDARAGIETTYLQKGTPRPLVGDIRTVVVLDGNVLMAITLTEMDYTSGRSWQPEPQVGDDELGAIVKTMVDKLH